MANTPDWTSCLATSNGNNGGDLLPLSAFYALRYHFGMLLGVDDFETEQAYHRAKMRLHNAWLHGAGVIWGFNVKVVGEEVHVMPGLALDAAGHELHLEADACLNVGAWFEKHKSDPDFKVTTGEDGSQSFDAHVVIRFKACLTRQVPSLLEPCENGSTGTAYSRVFETVEILLRPNKAPLHVDPYHRLRLLFGLDAPKKKDGSTTDNTPEDQAVLDRIAKIQMLPGAQQRAEWLAAFHQFAALDEIDLKPAQSEDSEQTLLFPGRDDDPVVLADISGLKLTKKENDWTLSVGAVVDVGRRPSHVATTTIQDLLSGSLGCCVESTTPPPALGPRVDPKTVTISNKAIVLIFDQPLQKSTVTAAVFSVTVFNKDKGWIPFEAEAFLDVAKPTVTLTPNEKKTFVAGLTRIIAKGTGPTPIMGVNNLPLAGATTDAPAPQGADFVWMGELPAK